MSDLKKLSKDKGSILLAEIGALLHDMGKCVDAHIKKQAFDCPQDFNYNYRKLEDIRREAEMPNLLVSAPQLSLLGEQVALDQFVKRSGSQWLIETLRRCHGAAHIEKEETDDTGKQSYQDTRMSSPFGIEGDHVSGLTNLLKQLPWDNVQQREKFLPELREAFEQALGETRRPENEITLWDWSLIVAALYKAALAGALLGYQPDDPNELRWRLLSVRFDGLGFLGEAHRIPDLLGRKRALQEALEQVRRLLEEEYPLGTEVYRDENGSVFVVPGCEKGNCTLDLLNLRDDENGKTLKELIEEKVREALKGEIVPVIRVDPHPWWGQDPKWKNKMDQGLTVFNDELPPVAEHLEPVERGADPKRLQEQWKDKTAEVCTVCGLRPQDPKLRERHICEVCDRRRVDRVKIWLDAMKAGAPGSTVWISEVADQNARVALLVGRFDLDHWLDGTLVRTLRVTDPASPARPKYVTEKIPSFVRLRRIWTAIREFWHEVCPADSDKALRTSIVRKRLELKGPRLEIRGQLQDRKGNDTLVSTHAYELVLPRGIKLSVVWEDSKENGRFITCDNLDYLASERQLGRPVKEVLKPGTVVRVEEPVGYGARNKEVGEFRVERVEEMDGRYIPVIPILAEPQTFMALVPAAKALDIVKEIKAKYEREMGKVRNRLPLHLGIVFAHRRTPLRALLDAGRRLLEFPGLPAAGWSIKVKDPHDENVCGVPKEFLFGLQNEQQMARELDAGNIPQALRKEFSGNSHALSNQASVKVVTAGAEWRIIDRKEVFIIRLENGTLKIYLVKDRHFAEIRCIELKLGGRKAIWRVPLMMGDGKTEDVWYPYVFRHGLRPLAPARSFSARNPHDRDDEGNPKEGWLMHVKDLQDGDTVYFTPATLDWVWLDTNARRFEIAYDDRGQRLSPPFRHRPYLLDELDTLEHIWQTLEAHLHRNQIHILRETIEAKRTKWGFPLPHDPGFRQFCRDLLAEAEWRPGPQEDERRRDKLPWEVEGRDKEGWLKLWADYAARGWLSDAVELYWEILKAGREGPEIEPEREEVGEA